MRLHVPFILLLCPAALAQPLDAETRCREAAHYKERSQAAQREGRLSDAMMELGQAVALCPSDTAARAELESLREQVVAEELKQGGPGGMEGPRSRRVPVEHGSEHLFGSPREELAFGQAVHGALWGMGLALTLTGDAHVLGSTSVLRGDPAPTLIMGAAVGGSTGFLLSSLFLRRPLPTGVVTSINSGTLWGAWLVGSWLAANDGGPALYIPAGATAGTLMGGLAGALLRPRPGQVALTNSVGIWSGVLSTFALGALSPGLPAGEHLRVAAMSSGAGLVLGGLAAPWLQVSRQRMFYMDLGGAAGLGVGLLATAITTGGLPRTTGQSIAVGSGVLTGLLLSAVLTWGMDMPKEPPPVAVAPLAAPGTMGLAVLAAF